MEKNNKNIINFASTLSEIIGQTIGTAHINPTTEGRYYYIQSPKIGAPMLLNHYRGPFFIDIHPDDFESISSGKISVQDYIRSANWQVGYFWGGGSMIGGGYYQPIDIISRKEEVRRYLQILSCRGKNRASGYMPSEEKCAKCFVANCPFSNYKEGNWSLEMSEYDPRKALFYALCERFEKDYPGYTLYGFVCAECIPNGEIWLDPNGHYTEDEPFSLMVHMSASVIQSLLMHEIEPENWNDYAKNFHFRLCNLYRNDFFEVTEESLKKVFEKKDFAKMVDKQPEVVKENVSRISPLKKLLQKIF